MIVRSYRLITVALVIMGCGSSPTSSEDTISGTWRPTFTRVDQQGQEVALPSITFTPDGKYLEDGSELSTYSISGKIITFASKAGVGGVAR